MGQYSVNNHKSAIGGAVLARYVRVKPNGTYTNGLPNVIACGPSDRDFGITTRPCNTIGDPVDVMLPTASGTIEMTASGAITIGADVYGDANGQITATPNNNKIGMALQAATASGDMIEVLRYVGSLGSLTKLFTGVSATDTVTNTTVETAFAQQYSIPANLLAAGDRLSIMLQGTVTGHNSTDTLNIKLYVGANVIEATGAINNAANDIFYISADVVVRTITAAGTIVATGLVADGAPGTATAKPYVFASATLDSTVAEVVKVTATWSVASASDIVRLDVLNISRTPA